MRQQIAFDTSSVRTTDSNGYLHVAKSNLTREEVADYYGREIPRHDELGLDTDKIYGVYRPAEELTKAVETFNGIPVLIRHEPDSAFDPKKALRIGATGTNAEFDGHYITNALSFHDAVAISLIESGDQKELSAGYTYDPVLEDGEFNGKKYAVKMTNIKGNHIALVTVGRAGPTVVVADSKGDKKMKEKKGATFLERLKKLVMDSELEEKVTGDSVKDRLMALIAEIAGEHAEEGETMTQIKQLIDQLSATQDSDSEEGKKKEGEEKDNFNVKDFESEPGKKPITGDSKPVGIDIKSITADIYKKVNQEVLTATKERVKAAEKVRPLVGIVDSFAFDSAEEIYKYALEKRGTRVEDYSPAAYAGMVDVMSSNIADAHISAVQKTMALDAEGKDKLLGKDISRFKRG